jgi:hypothetical protein
MAFTEIKPIRGLRSFVVSPDHDCPGRWTRPVRVLEVASPSIPWANIQPGGCNQTPDVIREPFVTQRRVSVPHLSHPR